MLVGVMEDAGLWYLFGGNIELRFLVSSKFHFSNFFL